MQNSLFFFPVSLIQGDIIYWEYRKRKKVQHPARLELSKQKQQGVHCATEPQPLPSNVELRGSFIADKKLEYLEQA